MPVQEIITKNQSSPKYFFVDTQVPRGHIWLSQKTIQILCNNNNQYLFCSSKSYNEAMKIEGINLPSSLFRKLPFSTFTYRIQQFFALLLSLYYHRKLAPNAILCLLSYDVIALAMVGLFLPKEVNAFDHNCIDQIEKSYIKSIFYKMLPKRLIHLGFENYICKYHTDKGRNALHFQHPLRKIAVEKSINNNDKILFAPSGGTDYDNLNIFAEQLSELPIKIYCKNTSLNKAQNIVGMSYFDDYDAYVYNSVAILIFADFQYRASGVFYEALANDKPVIFQDCLFARECSKKYENVIIWDAENPEATISFLKNRL